MYWYQEKWFRNVVVASIIAMVGIMWLFFLLVVPDIALQGGYL